MLYSACLCFECTEFRESCFVSFRPGVLAVRGTGASGIDHFSFRSWGRCYLGVGVIFLAHFFKYLYDCFAVCEVSVTCCVLGNAGRKDFVSTI